MSLPWSLLLHVSNPAAYHLAFENGYLRTAEPWVGACAKFHHLASEIRYDVALVNLQKTYCLTAAIHALGILDSTHLMIEEFANDLECRINCDFGAEGFPRLERYHFNTTMDLLPIALERRNWEFLIGGTKSVREILSHELVVF